MSRIIKSGKTGKRGSSWTMKKKRHQGKSDEQLTEIDVTKVQKLAKSLEFVNPGKKVTDSIESILAAPRGRRAAAEKAAKKIQAPISKPTGPHSDYKHNWKGELTYNSIEVELCDCLNPECQGCFWPCPECKGRRCSTVCQQYRTFAIAATLQSGGGPTDKTKITNPFTPDFFATNDTKENKNRS